MQPPRPKSHRVQLWLIGTACLFLTGCSFLNDAVWPTLTGSPPSVDAPVEAVDAADETSTVPAPVFDAAPFMATLNGSEEQLVAIGSRLPDHTSRLASAQEDLSAQANRVENPPSVPGETDFDRWARAQIELSRLNDDIVTMDILREDAANDTANIAIVVAHLTSLGQTNDIPEAEAVQLTNAGIHANELLVRLGRLQERLAADHDRWQKYAQAQIDRIGVQQAGAIVEPGTFEPNRTPATIQVGSDWPDSGGRFKGRKALMSINLSDPEIAYKDELRDLIQRVQMQYPDIAFELEVVGVDKAEVNAVIRLLAELDVKAEAFRTLQLPDDPPILRLFPR